MDNVIYPDNNFIATSRTLLRYMYVRYMFDFCGRSFSGGKQRKQASKKEESM